jgi:hypothetical protein
MKMALMSHEVHESAEQRERAGGRVESSFT